MSKSPSTFEPIVKPESLNAIVLFVETVIAPVSANVEPSKVKFASPFNPEPVPVTTLLFESFAREVKSDQDKFPDPSVVKCVPELPSKKNICSTSCYV